MYDELFSKVPDHIRLKTRDSNMLSSKAIEGKYAIVKKFINASDTFAEFAPGDCRFSFAISKLVKFVYGIDISDQRNLSDTIPENFKLIIYDGYNLNEIEDESVDFVFSDQLIEHLHPEDTELHFKLAHRKLLA
jgi:hypothetical protein